MSKRFFSRTSVFDFINNMCLLGFILMIWYSEKRYAPLQKTWAITIIRFWFWKQYCWFPVIFNLFYERLFMCTTLPSLLVVDHHCVKLTERSNLSRRRRKRTKRYLGISRSTKCFVKLNCLCHSMQNNFGTKLNDNIFKCRKTLREANRVKTYSSIKSDGRTPYINFVVQRR